jgi:PncC family amidohydrolase
VRSTINRLVKLLRSEKKTVALAESITCGLASHQFTTVKGASEVLKGSVICYSPDVKCSLLGISGQMLRKHTPESRVVTDKLAKKLQRLIHADVHAAITGLASADGSENKKKPVGTVFISVLYRKKLVSKRYTFKGSPLEVKKKACDALYRLVTSLIKE